MNFKPTPMLMGAGLLLWGWQSGLLLEGLLMAVVIEGASGIGARWEFSTEDFRKVRNLCILLCLVAVVMAFSNNEGPADFLKLFRDPTLFAQRSAGAAGARTVASVLRWLPMLFFPLVAMQVYHEREGLPREALSLVPMRFRQGGRTLAPEAQAGRTTDLRYPFFILCLFAASVHSSEDTSFFWGLSAVIVWALWPLRSRRFQVVFWGASLALAVALGYAGQYGLGRLQGWLTNYNPRWFSHSVRGGADPFQSKTGLGHIGTLKGSGRIVLQLTPNGGLAPKLLREASYKTYKSATWYSEISTNDFVAVSGESNKTSWVLLDKANAASANLSVYLPGGRGLLPLPMGAGRLDDLFVYNAPQRNDLGAVLAEGPGLVDFEVSYGPGPSVDAPPGPLDRRVPEREVPALDKVIDEMELRGLTLEQALKRIQTYFDHNFRYRSWQPPRRLLATNESLISVFLTRRRAGHCEYFATATVLLLRHAGFPARYAVGYAVHESSGAGYLVRERDAHAWCLVWNQRLSCWEDFDTTPVAWVGAEAKRAGHLEFLSDLWYRFIFELARLRWGQTQLRLYLLWGLAPVLGLLLYQIIFRRRRRRRAKTPGDAEIAWPGLDSEFYLVERQLAARGLGRLPGEPLSRWLARAGRDPAVADWGTPLRELLQLHYRYRFDPLGLDSSERQALKSQATACISSMSASERP